MGKSKGTDMKNHRQATRQFRFFAEQNGQTVQLDRIAHDGAVSTKANHFFGVAPNGEKLQCTRKVDYKVNGSKHVCSDKCMNAKGFMCECACGGKNHGLGSMLCEQSS